MSGGALRVLFHRQLLAQAMPLNPDKSQSFERRAGIFSLLRLYFLTCFLMAASPRYFYASIFIEIYTFLSSILQLFLGL
jgi:hypothetical protein